MTRLGRASFPRPPRGQGDRGGGLDPLPEWRSRALGTGAVVLVTGADSLELVRRAAAAEVDAIDRACSRFRSDSELERVNRAGGRPAAVGPRLLEALEVALRAARASDGDVDPTVGEAVRVLGYDRDFAAVPPDGPPLLRVATVPGWRQVWIDRPRGLVRVPPGVLLDLGATAKALAADRSAARAAEAARCGVLVSLGGDLASLLAVGFLALHVVTTVVDGYVPIRWLDAVVPFGSSYRPLWLGLGAVALDLLAAVLVTSLLRARLGHRAWRAVHWLAYGCWPVAFAHGLGTGSDPGRAWMLAVDVAAAGAVLAAGWWRLGIAPGRATAAVAPHSGAVAGRAGPAAAYPEEAARHGQVTGFPVEVATRGHGR